MTNKHFLIRKLSSPNSESANQHFFSCRVCVKELENINLQFMLSYLKYFFTITGPQYRLLGTAWQSWNTIILFASLKVNDHYNMVFIMLKMENITLVMGLIFHIWCQLLVHVLNNVYVICYWISINCISLSVSMENKLLSKLQQWNLPTLYDSLIGKFRCLLWIYISWSQTEGYDMILLHWFLVHAKRPIILFVIAVCEFAA